eukprot:13481-Heterococcus_DN1.PRE.2
MYCSAVRPATPGSRVTFLQPLSSSTRSCSSWGITSSVLFVTAVGLRLLEYNSREGTMSAQYKACNLRLLYVLVCCNAEAVFAPA